jgi:hypothetical protein
LRERVAQAPEMRGVIQVRLRWAAENRTQREPARLTPAISLVAQQPRLGRLRRERRPELSADRLVVISVDRNGRETDWRLAMNPRLLRAEVSGPDGRLSGSTYQVDNVTFDVYVPDLPDTDRVHVYAPRWTGTEYVLESLGSVEVRP